MVELRIDLRPALMVDGKEVSGKRLEILKKVDEKKSQAEAAFELGISPPVLNRAVKQMEERLGIKLVEKGVRGSFLTPDGKKILNALELLKGGVDEDGPIGVSPIGKALLEKRGRSDAPLEVSNDEFNFKLAKLGFLRGVVFDDPVYSFEFGITPQTIGIEKLYLVKNNDENRFSELRYGAQRIGFDYLDKSCLKYEVVKKDNNPPEDLNYFIEGVALTERERAKLVAEHAITFIDLITLYGNHTEINK